MCDSSIEAFPKSFPINDIAMEVRKFDCREFNSSSFSLGTPGANGMGRAKTCVN